MATGGYFGSPRPTSPDVRMAASGTIDRSVGGLAGRARLSYDCAPASPTRGPLCPTSARSAACASSRTSSAI